MLEYKRMTIVNLFFLAIYAVYVNATSSGLPNGDPSDSSHPSKTLVVIDDQRTPDGTDCQDKTEQDQQSDDTEKESQPNLTTKSDSEAERNEKLAKYLTKTRWTGRFTFTGQEDKPPAEEHYEIIEATKAEEGDSWNLTARIKYGGKDVTLPLPTLEIKWAGETPVITVDKMTIPGMGTFDARVLIRKGQYAGTWTHGKVGGHLFGKIEKIDDPKQPAEEDD